MHNPLVVEQGACTGSRQAMLPPVGTLQVDTELPAGAQDDLRFMVGACDAVPMMERLTATYLSTGSLDADPHFDALLKVEAARADALRVNTPDEAPNRMINIRCPKQIDYGVVWPRWGFNSGTGCGKKVTTRLGSCRQSRLGGRRPGATRDDDTKSFRSTIGSGYLHDDDKGKGQKSITFTVKVGANKPCHSQPGGRVEGRRIMDD